MNPNLKHAGIAGILTGLALVAEFTLFMISGYSPEIAANPDAALAFLRDRGAYLRWAVLWGALGVAARTIYIPGLAARLHATSPTRATAALYFGLLGGIGHGLVALSFWLGIPYFVQLAAGSQASAASAYSAFTAILSGFEGIGNFLLGGMLVAAGWAIIGRRMLPPALGWVGLLAGIATLIRVLAAYTPLAFAAFFPSLLLAVIWDIWAGIALWRVQDQPTGG